MNLIRWNEIPDEPLNPLMSRKVMHGEKTTVARLTMQKGGHVPMHSHMNEQTTMLEKGLLRFVTGEREILVHEGESLCIPPDVPHSVDALEDSVALDIFSPAREDWIRGDDAYLRKGK